MLFVSKAQKWFVIIGIAALLFGGGAAIGGGGSLVALAAIIAVIAFGLAWVEKYYGNKSDFTRIDKPY